EGAERLQQLEWAVRELDRRVAEKRQNLEQHIEGSDEALQRDLDGFDAGVRQREHEGARLGEQAEALAAELWAWV
ncbi:hypothetical protein B484DRAFT_407970, partial [Ochromonadaceae sp. CCMP2298]